VAVVDLDRQNAEAAAGEVRALGVKALPLRVDVSQLEETEEMVRRTLEEFGKIHILNNVAGTYFPMPFQDSERENWEKEINVCLYGVMNCCKSVVDTMMAQQHGKIVNVASDAGKAGEKQMAPYSAAKAGILGFTKSLAKEMGRYWINVNAVCPGTTKGTGMTTFLDEETEKRWVKAYTLRRLGKPADIANMIVFLSSEPADWITGQAISVNGGFYMG
jgi:2-hydroxycyclohexanecarboxyl-CoA dehydrogenase